jgi:dienelactone hydrolase
LTSQDLTDDDLHDFTRRSFLRDGIEKVFYVSGSGPAVIVMTEMPGISPQVARFARWVRGAGFSVYMPSLFGKDGAVASAEEGVTVFKKACASAEFRALEGGGAAPITVWLRALARQAHAESGGPGVGAIGMCFTGNFALSMMLEGSTMAPVVCQPSLPLEEPAGVGLPETELHLIRARLEREDLTVQGYRFEGDKWCSAQRFSAYAQALGPRFVGHVLPDSAANPSPPPFFKHVVASPHSVVTAHLIDEAGQPTVAARDQILAFFRSQLKPSSAKRADAPG